MKYRNCVSRSRCRRGGRQHRSAAGVLCRGDAFRQPFACRPRRVCTFGPWCAPSGHGDSSTRVHVGKFGASLDGTSMASTRVLAPWHPPGAPPPGVVPTLTCGIPVASPRPDRRNFFAWRPLPDAPGTTAHASRRGGSRTARRASPCVHQGAGNDIPHFSPLRRSAFPNGERQGPGAAQEPCRFPVFRRNSVVRRGRGARAGMKRSRRSHPGDAPLPERGIAPRTVPLVSGPIGPSSVSSEGASPVCVAPWW